MAPAAKVAAFTTPAEVNTGGGAAAGRTVRLTCIRWGVFAAPGAWTVICPTYSPAARPAVRTDTVRRRGVAPKVPLAGFTTSQGWSVSTLMLRLPAPGLLRVTIWSAGAAPPAVAAKFKLAGERARAAGSKTTLRT